MRSIPMVLALLAAPVFSSYLLAADDQPPDFSGTWQLNTSKSPGADIQAVTLTIADDSGKINYTRVVRERDGKEITSRFTCEANGSTCTYDEGGHKAKVSVWFDGSALVVLKTDGPKEDSVTQWKLQLAPDKTTMKVEFSHIEPSDKSLNLVFDKRAS